MTFAGGIPTEAIVFEQYLQNSSETQFKLEKANAPFGQYGFNISHQDGTNKKFFSVAGDMLQNVPSEED